MPESRTSQSVRFGAARWALLLGVAVVTYLVFPAPPLAETPVLRVGDIAPRAVVAPIGFTLRKSDEAIALEAERRAAAVPPVYRYDPTVRDTALVRARAFFSAVAEAGADPARIRAAAEGLRLALSDEDIAYLGTPGERDRLEAALLDLLDRALRGSVMEGVGELGAAGSATVLEDGRDRALPRDSIVTFGDLLIMADDAAQALRSAAGERLLRRLTVALVRPTLVRDDVATERRKAIARRSVDSVRARVKSGATIVTAHDTVTEMQHDLLVALRAATRAQAEAGTGGSVPRAAGLVLYDLIVLSPFWLLLMLYRRETWREHREMVFLAALMAVTIALAALMVRLFPARNELLPVPMAALVVSLLYNGRVAAVCALTLAIVLGTQWPVHDTDTLFFALAGGVAAAIGVRVVRRRQHLYLTVVVVAGAYAVAAVTVGLMHGWGLRAMVTSAVIGVVVAIVSTALALLVLPVAESATRITTNLTLLELADPGRPLLKRLALEAPGTWQHSLAMANLCEAGCNAIGANGLLARVGCYYHDIGKLNNPRYFVENQAGGESPHDRLTPRQSAQIIRRHVQDGLELAREARLPRVIQAFIPEHHGTQQIKFFLDRARGRPGEDEIDLADFRYPGPKPQSVETAVAMMADAAEAAVRVLANPTAEQVRSAIDHLIDQRIAAGQLVEAPITLRDIDRVKAEFARVLVGMYHGRIEYPAESGGITAQFSSIRRA